VHPVGGQDDVVSVTPRRLDDPREVLDLADAFLRTEPVRHNLIATLLHRCAAAGERGRFVVAVDDEGVRGISFQWPETFVATVTPMPRQVIEAVVDALARDDMALPGVSGEAATAAAFAGRWTERTRATARPVEGQRLYEVDRVRGARPTPGACRRATADDHDLAARWLGAFAAEIGEPLSVDPAVAARARSDAGELWIWDHDGPMALLGLSRPEHGAVRVGPVYTPPERRGLGYASALVGECSASVRTQGDRCLLYADLANPTSNAIYRRLGYSAVAEIIRYEFGCLRRS
jgi:ribosomal protein S18 acetylase RimI-like enzyme